jgi:hypothetical protein
MSNFKIALSDALGCVLAKDSKTLCHYNLKALQIYQNHLILSFYRPHLSRQNIKKEGVYNTPPFY